MTVFLFYVSAPTTPFDREAPYRSLRSPGVERFHSIKTATSPVGSASPDDEEVYSNWQQRPFDLEDTIEENEDDNADDDDDVVSSNHREVSDLWPFTCSYLT